MGRTRVAYITGVGLQGFHRELAASVGAEPFDVQCIKLPFALRYLKFLNVPIAVLKAPEGCDAYVCEGVWDLLAASVKKLWNPKAKIVMLYTFPLGMAYEGIPLEKRLFLPFARFLARRIDVAFTCSEMMRERISEIAGCPVFVVYPYAGKEFFALDARLDNNDFVDVSRDTPEKGLGRLKQAFALLPFKLDIVDRFARPRREGNVEWHGFVEDLPGFLSRHAFFAHLPALDPFNIAVLEAMACGTIPVVNENCGIAEIISGAGLGGLLVPAGAEEAAKRITEIAGMGPKERADASSKAKAAARKLSRESSLATFRKHFQASVYGGKAPERGL